MRKLPSNEEEEKSNFEQGFSRAACPWCGNEEYYFHCDVGLFFICTECKHYSWLKYTYPNDHCFEPNGLKLVIDPLNI